jgi:hypothetical protein
MQWVATLLALASLHGSATIPYSANHPHVYAGTYVINLCKGPCTPSVPSSYGTGVVVLFDEPVRNNLGRVFRTELDRYPVNGCFVLKAAEAGSDSIAKLAPEGFFSWALVPSDNTIGFQLYRSPDGGYEIHLKLAAKGLNGTGMTWGGAAGLSTSGPYPAADSVTADRVGEPDVSRCPSRP